MVPWRGRGYRIPRSGLRDILQNSFPCLWMFKRQCGWFQTGRMFPPKEADKQDDDVFDGQGGQKNTRFATGVMMGSKLPGYHGNIIM